MMAAEEIVIQVSQPDADTAVIALGKLALDVDVSKLLMKEVIDGIFAELAQAKVSLLSVQSRLEKRVADQKKRTLNPHDSVVVSEGMSYIFVAMGAELGSVRNEVERVKELKDALSSLHAKLRLNAVKEPEEVFLRIKLLFNAPHFTKVIVRYCPDFVDRLEFARSLVKHYEYLCFIKPVPTINAVA